MRLELYQAETARQAERQVAILEQARALLNSGRPLTMLEESGVLHALQVLIENAIGKAKQWLKASGRSVPISVYDAFAALAEAGLIPTEDLTTWNALVGLRNRIVHDYMNIDPARLLGFIQRGEYQFVVDFLVRPSPSR